MDLKSILMVVFVAAVILRHVIYSIVKTRRQRIAHEKATRAAEDAEYQRMKLVGRQDTWNGTLFNALERACKRNRVSNILPSSGKASEGTSPITVGAMPSGGVKHIVVRVPQRGYRLGEDAVLRFTIDLFNEDPTKRLSVYKCPYGQERYYPEDKFSQMVLEYVQFVEYYSIYPKTMEDNLKELGITLAVEY